MKNSKDEKIIAALLASPTIKEAAKVCGMSESSLHKKLKDDDFKQKYADARQALLSQTTCYLQGLIADSVRVMYDVLKDSTAANQVRLNAADALLRHCYKLTEITDFDERISALEKIARQQQQ